MKKGNKMSIEECLLDTGKSVETKMRMMTDFEKNCYGISEETIRKEYMNSLTAKFSGLEMVVMGILSDVQEEDAKLDYVKSATKIKSETSQYDNEINKLKEDKVRYSRLLNDEFYENIINDIEEIECDKNRVKEIVNLFFDEIKLIHQDKRYSVITVKLKDNFVTNLADNSTINHYTTIIIDKRETNKIELVKAISLVSYENNNLLIKDIRLDIGEAFKLNIESNEKLKHRLRNKNPYDFIFKKIDYLKLSFYRNGDSFIEPQEVRENIN